MSAVFLRALVGPLTVAPGETGQIGTGDWIVEQPTTIHSAVNRSGKTIVIYLATLFPIGGPAAIPVK